MLKFKQRVWLAEEKLLVVDTALEPSGCKLCAPYLPFEQVVDLIESIIVLLALLLKKDAL